MENQAQRVTVNLFRAFVCDADMLNFESVSGCIRSNPTDSIHLSTDVDCPDQCSRGHVLGGVRIVAKVQISAKFTPMGSLTLEQTGKNNTLLYICIIKC